ncbi:FAD-dependent oxidoreductase [Geminicoccaceae bacterium 1502E]|nr:FAD-dependent oxidoreductase [Geminicoccaceae bacterium 1502E]
MGAGQGRHVVVVGAGIVGASCALFLQRDGNQVTLVDPREPGGGTSLGNAGIISLGSVSPVGTRAMLARVPSMLLDRNSPLSVRWRHLPELLPWLARLVLASRPERVEELSRALAALLDRADQAHDILIQQCGLANLVRSGGWLKIACSPEKLEASTAGERAMLERHGRAFEMLDAAQVRDLEPALSPEVAGGLLLPHNRAVRHPQRYVAGIVATFLERGGRHVRAPARELLIEEGRLAGVASEAGTLPADAVVIAAGAFSRKLAGHAGLRVPLEAERGYHLMLPHPAETLRRPVYSIDDGFVLAPMEHGIRLTGGVELASLEAPPDFRRVRRLVPRAQRLLPQLSAEIRSEWQGHRPSLPDSLPVIGRAPGHDNLFLAFGHQHIGLTLGPVTGQLVADLVAGREPPVDLAPYRADRRFH